MKSQNKNLKLLGCNIAKLVMILGLMMLLQPSKLMGLSPVPVNPQERPQAPNPLSYIVQMGPILFGMGGAAILPESILSGMYQGTIPPIMQFILTNHLMSACVKDIVQEDYLPKLRASYVKADYFFKYGKCRIAKCFQQVMLLGVLTELSPNPRVGGAMTADQRSANQQIAVQMVQSFNNSPCGDQGGDTIDPLLIQLIQTVLQ